MDFLRNHTHLVGGGYTQGSKYTRFSISHQTYGGQGGDTRQLHTFSISRQTSGRQDPPHANPSKPAYHAKPFQSFTTEIPYGVATSPA
jgi:hypothetical protein